MTKVKLLSSRAGSSDQGDVGEIIDVSASEATALVNAGKAEYPPYGNIEIDNTDLTDNVYTLKHNLDLDSGNPEINLTDNNGVEVSETEVKISRNDKDNTDIDFGGSITGTWNLNYVERT